MTFRKGVYSLALEADKSEFQVLVNEETLTQILMSYFSKLINCSPSYEFQRTNLPGTPEGLTFI